MKKLFAILSIVSFLHSCVKVEPVSSVPEVRFKSFEYDYFYDEKLDQNIYQRVLEFEFIDGDADLGVYEEIHSDESLPIEMRFGIFIHFFEKVGNSYVERFFTKERMDSVQKDSIRTDLVLKDSVWVEERVVVEYWEKFEVIDTLLLHQLLPYNEKLNRVGQNKTVKGTIRVGILFPVDLPYDTMRLEFFVRDRALNKSNIDVTNDFGNELNVPGGIQ